MSREAWKKCLNCFGVGIIVIVIITLAYAIRLTIKQQEILVRMNEATDNIQLNIKRLEEDRATRELVKPTGE